MRLSGAGRLGRPPTRISVFICSVGWILTMISSLISVIVATRNRADDLVDALASLETQTLPASQFEIVVVDNGSSDDTKDVVLMPRKLNSIIYISEPVLGLSRARNAGIRAAHGEIIAFVDDDAIADPNWLMELKNAHRDTAIQCVGGRIEGRWLCSKPRWFHPDLYPLLSVLDLGDQPAEFMPPSNHPVGANISFRREVFEKHGYFNTALGRGGSMLSGGEEVALFCKLRNGGDRSIYCPKALVYHKISADKLAFTTLFRNAFVGGSLAAMLKQKRLPASKRNRTTSEQPVPFIAKLFRLAIKTTMALGYARQCVRGLLPQEQPGNR